jgi:hypothetical protein
VSVGVDYDYDFDDVDYDYDHVQFVFVFVVVVVVFCGFFGAEGVGAGAVSAAFVACEGEAVGSASFGGSGAVGWGGCGGVGFGVFGSGAVAWGGWGAFGCESDVFVCVAGAGAVGGSEFLY